MTVWDFARCTLQAYKCVIHLVTSPWFPIITVMNPLLLCNHCCNSCCRAVKWLSLKIGVRCSSTLSLWQCGGILKWFHHMMVWWPNASSMTTSATRWYVCVGVCVCSIGILKMYQPGDGSESLIMCGFDCAMLNLDQSHPSVSGMTMVRKYCFNMDLGEWDGIHQCIHLCGHVWVCVGVSVCAKGRYSPASWLILLMASSKTRREAEKHGVRERAKRMQSRAVALWWRHSNLSQERF